MIVLDFWEVFSAGQSFYILGADLSSYQPKIIEVESINIEDSTFICVNGKKHQFGGVQGLNVRNMKFLDNWLEAKNINKSDIVKINIFD